MQFQQLARVLAVGLTIWCGGAALGQTTTLAQGQKVEVREGDAWSPASIVKKEGRKYLIHYEGADAATDEWVTADRVRAAGAAGGGATGAVRPAPATGALTPPAAPPPTTWATNQKVQVKWGGMWRDASIVNQRSGWYLVQYPPSPFREWVEPYRIRKTGSIEDHLGYCRPNPTVRNNDGPPDHEPGEPPLSDRPRNDAAPEISAADAAAYKETDLSSARLLSLESPGKTWKLTPDASDFARQIVARVISLRGANTEPLDSVKSLVIARGKTAWGYVCHVSGMPHEGTRVRLERLDLDSGVSAAVWPVSSSTLLLDVSPDGKTALFRADGFGAGKSNRVDIWSLEGTAPKKTLAFTPFGGDVFTADIKGGIFADATHVFLWNGKGTLVLWDIATAKPVYSAQMNAGCMPAVSAGAKYIAINTEQRALVLESLTGKVLAEMPLDTTSGAAFGFSPTGTRLAAYAGHAVYVWDLSNGNLVSEFSTPGDLGGKMANILPNAALRLDLVGDGFGVLDGQYLLDFQRRVVLWNYEQSGEAVRSARTVSPGGQYVYVCRDNARGATVLSLAKLPHPEALKAAESIGDDNFLLKPGMKVSLDVSVPCTAQQRQQITSMLTRRIKDAGLVLADNQPIVIHALVEPGKSQQREYRHFGSRGTDHVTVTPQIAKLSVEADGKRVWETQKVTSAGFMISLKQGQSVQDAVNEASRPDIGFFDTAAVPRYLPKPREPAWFGASILTGQGIRPAPAPARPLEPDRQPPRSGPNHPTA